MKELAAGAGRFVSARIRDLRTLLRPLARRLRRLESRPAGARRERPLRLARLEPGALTFPPDADYLYAPVSDEGALDADAVENALLCLSHRGYDFVLVSRSLGELPALSAPPDRRQSVVFSSEVAGVFLGSSAPRCGLRGRLIRMPGLQEGREESSLASLLPGSSHDGAEVWWGEEPAAGGFSWDCSSLAFREPERRGRPCVFVWPVLMAVGGVERNTIEVMRQLRSRYDFVVVTIERLNERLGSLHHQLKGLAEATYDLAELGPQSDFLSMLATLKRTWKPDMVWICNGSPWQCDHAEEIRRLYADVPIVDQQVYDTEVGWITRYHEPGIQSFDRFVAINSRIRRRFEEDLGMDPDRIDLIYHAVDVSRFRRSDFSPERVRSLRAEYGFPQGRPLFLFAGRMAPQKRPEDFVRLAARLVSDGLEASFLMLGDGELGPAVDAAIAASAPEAVRRLRFTDRVPELMAIADGLVITSAFEGLPIAMLEALSMGVPVLSTDVGDVGLVLESYGSGRIVPRIGDEDALLESFRAWHDELAGYRQAALAAAESVRERFSAARVAAEYEACWTKAMRSRGASRSSLAG